MPLLTQEGDVVSQEEEVALEQQRANKCQHVGDREVAKQTVSRRSELRQSTDPKPGILSVYQ